MNDVPIIKAGEDPFAKIPASARLAILLPTGRWTPLAQSIIGSLVGVASEEVAVLIADNCENAEKRDFLKKIRSINPYVIAISHEKNIGSAKNFFYLFDWCRDVEFCAIMADDDWVSPTYHVDSYRTLLDKPFASGAAAGTTLVDFGDGKLNDVSQPSMRGDTPIARITQWNGSAARATMYNASRRATLEAAVEHLRTTPLSGLTMAENLWELNRLAFGDFLNVPGNGCFIHYPSAASRTGDGTQTQRFYDLLCRDAGLQFPFVYFTALSTAIQCAIFLMGDASPIADPEQKAACGQHVFRHIFTNSFLPRMSGESSHEAAATLFAQHPEVLLGFSRYCKPPFSLQPVLDRAVIDWFIQIIRVFESRPLNAEAPLSERFTKFIEAQLSTTPL